MSVISRRELELILMEQIWFVSQEFYLWLVLGIEILKTIDIYNNFLT